MSIPFHASFCLLLFACPALVDGEAKGPPGEQESGEVDAAGDTSSDSAADTGSDTGTDTGEDSAEEPGVMPLVDCATVIYGDSSVHPALWVNAAAGASGDGSEATPLLSLADALAVATDQTVIWVAAGDYEGGLSIDVSGVAVVGEGREATRILGSDATANVESNPREGGGTVLCALSLEGGAPGAVAESGELALYDLAVSGASAMGVVARGAGRSLRLDGVSVEGTVVGAGDGTGVLVADGASATITNGDVTLNEGMGIFARDEGTLLSVRDSRVDANGHGVPEEEAGGVVAQFCDQVELAGVDINANVARGVATEFVTLLTIDDCSVTATTASGVAAHGISTIGGTVQLTSSSVGQGTGAGLVVHAQRVVATDLTVEGVEQAADGAGGVGILVGQRVNALFTRVTSSSNARAGLAMMWADLSCEDCEFSGNGQVGLYHDRCTVTLDGARMADNGQVGLMPDSGVTEQITVANSVFGPHPYAAIWGWSSLDLSGSTVYGHEGFEVDGELSDGFAVYVEGSNDPIVGNEFLDAEHVAVVGAGFLGDLGGNTWNNPGTDFVAVKTADAETIGGLDEIPEYALNPGDAPGVVAPTVDRVEIWDAR